MPYQIVHPILDAHFDNTNWIGIIQDGRIVNEDLQKDLREAFIKATGERFNVGTLSAELPLGWGYVDGFVIQSLPYDLDALKKIHAKILTHKRFGSGEGRTNACQ